MKIKRNFQRGSAWWVVDKVPSIGGIHIYWKYTMQSKFFFLLGKKMADVVV